MDGALDEFRLAIKFRFDDDELVGRDKHTDTQSHQFSKSSCVALARRQYLLPAQNSVIMRPGFGPAPALTSFRFIIEFVPMNPFSKNSSRREFLRQLSLGGAAVAAGIGFPNFSPAQTAAAGAPRKQLG
ncbi:MAG TPA: twin-arginine translocation signal domain-containing protein, partial [Verrucomicrobiae bacterium]